MTPPSRRGMASPAGPGTAPPARLRAAALPVVAAALVSGVLGVQAAHGGGDFVPRHPADPCVVRTVTSVSTGIEAVTEEVVLFGLDRAACRLGISREALALQLAESHRYSNAQLHAMRAGLLDAVTRLSAQGKLPPAADLANEAIDASDLNRFVKLALRALPDSLINKALKTDDVLRRTINDLDLRTLLANVTNPDDLNRQVNATVTKAVKDALVAYLKHLL